MVLIHGTVAQDPAKNTCRRARSQAVLYRIGVVRTGKLQQGRNPSPDEHRGDTIGRAGEFYQRLRAL